MVEQILKLVAQNANEVIIQNNNVPGPSKDGVMKEVATQISEGIGGQIKQGNLSQVISIFKGGNTQGVMNNPIIRQITSSAVAAIVSKFDINSNTAQNVVGTILPKVIEQFIQKTNDPNDTTFDLTSILKSFSSNPRIDDLLSSFGDTKDKDKPLGDVFGKLFGQ